MKRLLLILLILFFIPIFQANATTPIKILLVPGHDNDISGAQYGNIKEADMNLNLATRIYNILRKDKRFEVHITRKIGGYTKEFEDYFSLHDDEIVAFQESSKKKQEDNITNGSFIEKENPPHNKASEDMAIKLYGINKWANDNKMSAVIHIHFNDYPRLDKWTKGKYKGFAIYTPDTQMINWVGSGEIASKIFTQLKKKYAISNYEKESSGIVHDQSLIALGSNGTLIESVRSILIEYGYIYRFPTKKTRFTAYTNMTNLTVTGIKNYFFKK